MYGQPMYGQPMQPMYGQPMQPMYGQPNYMAPPPPQQGPTIIKIDNDNNDGAPCKFCAQSTGQVVRKKMGCVAICWCLCLLGTGVLWLIPCCSDGCKDSELVCIKCQQVKNVIPATCC